MVIIMKLTLIILIFLLLDNPSSCRDSPHTHAAHARTHAPKSRGGHARPSRAAGRSACAPAGAIPRAARCGWGGWDGRTGAWMHAPIVRGVCERIGYVRSGFDWLTDCAAVLSERGGRPTCMYYVLPTARASPDEVIGRSHAPVVVDDKLGRARALVDGADEAVDRRGRHAAVRCCAVLWWSVASAC